MIPVKRMQNVSQFYLLVLSCCFLFACHPEKPYKKNGISFTVPAGWKISEEQMFETTGSVAYERAGFLSAGQVIVTYVNDSLDLKSAMNQYMEVGKMMAWAMRSKFNDPVDGTFNKYPALVSRLQKQNNRLSAQFEEVYCFNGCGRTYTVIIQQAEMNVASNKKAIDEIVNSFVCY